MLLRVMRIGAEKVVAVVLMVVDEVGRLKMPTKRKHEMLRSYWKTVKISN